jgi:regulator of cell morphogenesis and NO signaling
MLDKHQTVADIVQTYSECAPVFQRHGIDFCCRGKVSIEAACHEQGIDLQALLHTLEDEIEKRGPEPRTDFSTWSTRRLVDHIVGEHHGYLREALPFLTTLSAKVARVHGKKDPRLAELATLIQKLADTFLPHLDAEERVIFPLLQAQSAGPERLEKELVAMMSDHSELAELLKAIRAAAGNFVVPEGACNSHRTLLSELVHLETDTFQHVYLENHVLSPRFATRKGK